MARAKTQLLDLKASLEKLMDENDQQEKIMDELNILQDFPVNATLIKESKLGKTLSKIKDKFEGTSANISAKSKEILIKWKRIIESSFSDQLQQLPKSNAKKSEDVVKFDTAPTVSPMFSSEYKNSLTSTRKTIVNVFMNMFKDFTNKVNAENIAHNIEKSLDEHFSSVSASKVYTAKAKQLSFNLKKNDQLRDQIIKGQISFKDLVTLTPTELATHDKKLEREKVTIEENEGRRLDWLDENKTQIQLEIGIDPNNTWSYARGDDQMSEPDADPPDI